jgi:hypothetical protein
MNDTRSLVFSDAIAIHLANTPTALRIALARLARGQDDPAHALSLLLLLRAASEDGNDVELSPHDGQTLATIEDPTAGRWIADLLPVSIATVQEVLSEMPELALTFAAWRSPDGIVIRALTSGPLVPPPRASERATPAELPSLDLLVEAGLFAESMYDVSRKKYSYEE